MQSKKSKVTKVKDFKILITGDENYNNISKFNTTMDDIYSNLDMPSIIYTYGAKYGAELLGQLYAQQNHIVFKTFTIQLLRRVTTRTDSQKYHMIQNIAIEQVDIVLIFSNIYNKKIKMIIDKCKSTNTRYFLIKE